MKVFILEDLEEDQLKKFIEFSNANWDDEQWIIFIDSSGGSVWIAETILNILNKKALEQKNSIVTLHIARAYSCAFSIAFRFKGNINILDSSRGMYHLSSFKDEQFSNNKHSRINEGNYSQMIKDSMLDVYKDTLQFASLFMTLKELQMYKKGKQIFFSSERMKEIAKKLKINLVS